LLCTVFTRVIHAIA